MDAKETHLVADVHQLIANRSFHERDILGLLILLREHAADPSPVRELGDFVAHREKDRGALKKYVQHVAAYLEAAARKAPAQVQIKSVYSSASFRESLNAVFDRFGLPPLSVDLSDDVLTCVMSLLQDVRLLHNRKEIGCLGLGRFYSELWLCAAVIEPTKRVSVVFPALTVPNRYCPAEMLSGSELFSGLVEARCTKGRLRLYVGGADAA
jgi:hypothetical protein